MTRAPSARLRVLPLAALMLLPVCGNDEGGGADAGAEPAVVRVHYHRADGVYEDALLEATVDGADPVNLQPDGTDAFGAVFRIEGAGAGTLSYALRPAGAVLAEHEGSLALTGEDQDLYLFAGLEAAFEHPPALPGPDQVAIHYWRPDGAYAGWGLHLWGDDVAEQVTWQTPAPLEGDDPDYGAHALVDLQGERETVNLIVHKGDQKDPGPDMQFLVSQKGRIVFLRSGSDQVFPHPVKSVPFTIQGAAAHWIDVDTIAVPASLKGETFELRVHPTGGIEATGGELRGGQSLPLTPDPAGLTAAQKARWPHLGSHRALKLATEHHEAVPEVLKGQLVVAGHDASGAVVTATGVQIPGVLDALFAYDGALGVSFPDGGLAFRLWAPTARAVRLHVFDVLTREPVAAVDMTAGDQGTWTHARPDRTWLGHFYRYEVEVYVPSQNRLAQNVVTDPYAVSLSRNGEHAQIVDLADPALKPAGWDALVKPLLAGPQDIVIYETHLRDFSAGDLTVPEAHRGTYLAFTYDGSAPERPLSDGMRHLQALQAAGLTHLHLLPVFDLATIDEDPAARVDLDDPVETLCAVAPATPADFCEAHGGRTVAEALGQLDPATPDAQAALAGLRGVDSFNWGYDPFHYTVPEGSYATEADGPARILEMRRMVQALAESGMRVVMDVVYNHTNAAGQSPYSVLDRIVPGYYHRLGVDSGAVETSTCCANTASEHVMMEKLMTDSLLTWARDYKVDAFRFDLMGHHMKDGMLRVRDALRALTPEQDGVDGTSIYLYGEGWNFGEVMNDARGVNATQLNMAGTGIGTFNDRLRDGVRGGGPFDSGPAIRRNQGFVNGLWYDPNELNTGAEAERTRLLQVSDWIRVGLAGSLKDFRLLTASDQVRTGGAVSYNGQPAGYTDAPTESINYVSKHDNQTLWDNNQYKLPRGTPMDERVRAQNVAVDLSVLGQAVPFLHMGVNLLRSKSMERDSYDSGDWFNRVDFSYADNNWNVGLPREDKDGANWTLIQSILSDASIDPQPAHIEDAAFHLREMLAVRAASPLFRLGDRAAVMQRLDFLNVGSDQLPGVIVMSLTDGACAGEDLDPAVDAVLAIFNARDEPASFEVPGASGFALHPILASSADGVVRTATAEAGVFQVPPRTTAVFVQPQAGEQGPGLPCNTR